MIRRKSMCVGLFMISAQTFAQFDDGCGGLHTHELKLNTKVCARGLAEGHQGIEIGACEYLLNEVERVNAFLENHDLGSTVGCTPERIRTIQGQLLDAAAVLDRARYSH